MPHVPVPVLAIFGRYKVTALDACIEAAAFGAEERNAVDEMRPVFAAMMLASVLHGSENTAPTWPMIGPAGEFPRGTDGQLDRRTFRRLVARVDLKDLKASKDVDSSPALADDDVGSGMRPAEIATMVELARWNVPVREYGDSSDDDVLRLAVSLAADCLPTSGRLSPTYRKQIRDWVAAHVANSVAMSRDADVKQALAPLRHLVHFGCQKLYEFLPLIYRTAMEDLAELDAGQLLTAPLQAALVGAAPINALLYLDSLKLGGEVAVWQPQSSTEPGGLLLPTILGTAFSWHGQDWWPELMKAAYSGDSAEIAKKTVELHRLGLLIAIRRGTLGVTHRDRATGDAAPEMVSFDEDGDESKKPRLRDTFAGPEPGKDQDEVFTRVLSQLGDDRSVRAALLQHYMGCTLKEIGQQLGVGKSQADNLARQGLQRMRDHPGIESLIFPT